MNVRGKTKEQPRSELVEISQSFSILEASTDERQLVEEKLQQVIEEWSLTFDSITDMVSIHDNNFKVVRVNKAYADALNMKPEELIGRNCYEVVHELEEPFPNCPHKLSLETKKPAMSQFFDPHLGIHLEVSTSPIFDNEGEVIGTVHIAKDITERKQAEDTLQKQTHDLGERVKELNCLYAITHLVEQDDLTVDEILQGVTDIIPPSWQYPDITCARIRLSDKEFQSSNFVETAWKQSDVIVVNGKKTGTIDVHYIEEMPESDEGPFLKEERNLIHVIAERLGHIIEHRITQDSLQALYEQEKELRERVQSDMQRRIDFTRNLIHELKTPLTALLATSQLLYEEEQDKRLGRLAKYVWEGANDLNNWIDALHDVVKGEIGTLKLELKLFDISKLLFSITSETRALAQQYGVSVTLNLSGNLPKVIADEARIRQVVLNLLNNAFKYASEGRTVTIACSANNRFLEVEVVDRGPGIPFEEQKSLFESGYQAAHRADPPGGLGIGLTLCKLLIELHGGKIWVNSKVGEGTSLIFTLPLQK